MARHKRLSGGQPGNQNARKHGFYAGNLTEKELSFYWELVNNQGLDPQLALVRVKLETAFAAAPGNHRILLEGVNLIAKISRSKLGLDEDGTEMVKKISRSIFEAALTGDVELTKRVGSEFLKALENPQNERGCLP